MKKSNFILHIVFNYALAVVFIWLATDYVNEFGWGFFSILAVFFATNDFVRASKMLQIYYKIKKNSKP